jgi:hypothetical protein
MSLIHILLGDEATLPQGTTSLGGTWRLKLIGVRRDLSEDVMIVESYGAFILERYTLIILKGLREGSYKASLSNK